MDIYKSKNKRKKSISIVILLLYFFTTTIFFTSNTYGENIKSGSFEIIDFNINKFNNNIANNTSYSTLVTSDEFLNSIRFSSGSYRIGIGITNTWKASVPTVQCFETITSGVTNCTHSSVSNGMIQVCGEGGCYNKARFEINPNGNPIDTLYAVYITTDSSWNSYQIVDGNTFIPKSLNLRNINDYLTESSWENTIFNIKGLRPGTTYHIRIVALHGDFTETELSPQASATTGLPLIHFDIDIGDTSNPNIETNPPYVISIGSMVFSNVSTASNLIWIDFGTNVSNGSLIQISGTNGGLFSISKSALIPSGNIDLNNNQGFGVNLNTITQQYLGPFTVNSNYNNGGNIVGIVGTTSNTIFTSSNNPIYKGRASLFVKARTSATTPASSDYQEKIIFSIVPNF